MKTINHKILIILAMFGFLFGSCESQLEEQFYNPEQYQAPEETLMPGMFSNVVYQWKIFVQDYGEYWWGLGGWGITAYSQIGVRPMIANYDGIYNTWPDLNGGGFDETNDARTYFNHMYERLRPWGLMKNLIETGDEAFIKENQLYYDLVNIIKDYAFLRNVDFFNSIPYFDALRGAEGVFFVKYDDPKEIYIAGLKSIKESTERLQSSYSAMSSESKALFTQQDLAFHGDINKWIEWATAVRLKYAVRVSGVDEALAKEHIQDVLNKNTLPKADLTWDPPFTTLSATLSGGGETWVRGMIERFTSYFIPNVIMKRMNHGSDVYEPGIDDPRLPVIAMPTKFGDYRGIRMDRGYEQNEPYREQRAEYFKTATKPVDVTDDQWSLMKAMPYLMNYGAYRNHLDVMLSLNSVSNYNLKTLVFNETPVYMVSLAETDLLLAEIALKNLGSTGKNAAEHLSDAVKHSVDFWYWYNGRSTYNPEKTYFPDVDLSVLSPTKPNTAIINQYADFIKEEYNDAPDKLEIIMQQKYIHLNMIGIYELWTELRRTRRPKLEPVTTLYDVKSKTQIERAHYPASEQSTNAEEYKKVQDQDNYSSPIFWVKNPSESFYRDSYID
ncbi:MAG: SusD/RagB family nutrient-binding outer membrane lipoprotein [Proteiniphilum sp.]|nr:SusD/RagB family nutrient-binding outer membrane lipoprotein [Proteiniphilum sp.]MDD3076177.1 SusD/RagB family nutrient-binding outer membrane lipoprotein [Proteiniphilum sp.]MDD3956105.1 SusD/RagB family nutrient-binding outer membrane lipoprotein [Proteiniphilum sp.]MDD4451576.1 SusD/RagB family nutrient-binding outer membrane lipoprotein [Proteiniphilum sp.]